MEQLRALLKQEKFLQKSAALNNMKKCQLTKRPEV